MIFSEADVDEHDEKFTNKTGIKLNKQDIDISIYIEKLLNINSNIKLYIP